MPGCIPRAEPAVIYFIVVGILLERLKVLDADLSALERILAHARLVLLNNKPLAAGSLGSRDDSRDILNTLTKRTELESSVLLLLILVETDQSVRITLLLTLNIEILKVNYRSTTAILLKICNWLITSIFYLL